MIAIVPLEFISIESDGVHLIIQAQINNIQSRLLIDTGASRTVFDQNRIEHFVPEPDAQENEQLSTGLGTNEMKSQILTLDSLTIGNFTIKDYPSVIIDMGHINQSFEAIGLPPIDGVIGGDILLEYKALIDYRKKELRLRFPKKMLSKN